MTHVRLTHKPEHMHRLRVVWGIRIREARQAAGYTQASLAEAIGVDQANVSRWERGAATPRDTRRRQLGELLGVDPSVLFSYDINGDDKAA